MISYIEYLNIPIALGLAIIGVFLIMQIVGEILEFKGKVVPEFIKIRKYFARKKQERQTMREMSATIHDVKTVLNSVESHYSEDNIAKRDAWMKWVNDRAVVYDQSIEVLKEEMDKNTEITMSLYIESKRNSIISRHRYSHHSRSVRKPLEKRVICRGCAWILMRVDLASAPVSKAAERCKKRCRRVDYSSITPTP